MHHISERIQKTIASGFPMVIYRKPGDQINLIVQEDKETQYVDDYTEQGFVFAPFDDLNKTILIPYNRSTQTVFEDQSVTDQNRRTSGILDNVSDIFQKESHISLVKKGIKEIKTGRLRKVVLSRQQQIRSATCSAESLFLKLLERYQETMVYLWFHPETGIWLGATPETLLQTDARRFNTMALAGTQEYKGSLKVEWGTKEIDEQQLVTDEIVQRLHNVSKTLTVDKAITYRAGNLLHLKTAIQGVFDGTQGLQLIIKALHPTPAVCGLPKEEAKDFILNNEGYDRAYYTGFLGELNKRITVKRATRKSNIENQAYGMIKKQTHLFVNLRCMQFTEGLATLYIGGGITLASDPESEWEETLRKAETLGKVL